MQTQRKAAMDRIEGGKQTLYRQLHLRQQRYRLQRAASAAIEEDCS